MNDQELKELVEASMPSIRQRLVAEMEGRIFNEIQRDVTQRLNKLVADWFAAEFGPLVLENLNGQKAELLKVANETACGIAQTVASSLKEALATKLKDSYNRTKLIEALFGR